MKLSRLQFYTAVVTPAAVLMALEIVSSRVLAPHFGSSVYVWGSIIGVFLAAMSVGYALGGWLADRQPSLANLGRLILAAAFTQTLVLLAGRQIVAYLGDLTGGSPSGTLLVTAVLFGPCTVFFATVAPYAVKIATRDLALLGGTAGHLYAISTAASLVGTLGATFVLIPRFGLETILRLLLFLTAAAALVALVSAPRKERLNLALGVSLILLAVIPFQLGRDASVGLLADRITPYQSLRVVESDGYRFLYSDGTIHGSVGVTNHEPFLRYTRQTPVALLIRDRISTLLVLGMGSGSVGTFLQSRLPELQVEYVEIDPAVPELARQHLFFEDSDSRRVHVDDARRFLLSHPARQWDFIYCDTYIGHSVPFHLSTVEFFREVRGHLNPGGVFGLNLIADLEHPFSKAMLRSLRSVFPRVYIFAVPGENYVFFATDADDAPSRDELMAKAQELDGELAFDPPLTTLAKRLREPDLELAGALFLTDQYAPVNHLIRFDSEGSEWRRNSADEAPQESSPGAAVSDDDAPEAGAEEPDA